MSSFFKRITNRFMTKKSKPQPCAYCGVVGSQDVYIYTTEVSGFQEKLPFCCEDCKELWIDAQLPPAARRRKENQQDLCESICQRCAFRPSTFEQPKPSQCIECFEMGKVMNYRRREE